MDSKGKKAYRTKLFADVYAGIIPERIPIWDCLTMEYLVQYAGKDLMTAQYSYTTELFIEIYEKAMEICRGTCLPEVSQQSHFLNVPAIGNYENGENRFSAASRANFYARR